MNFSSITKLRPAPTLGLALALGVTLGGLTGGGFMHSIIVRFFGFFVALVAFITLLLMLLCRLCKGQRSGLLTGERLGCAACVLCYLGFAGAGPVILRYRDAELRGFVEDMLPLLDDYKKQYGRYPASLTEVTKRDLPYFLKRRGRYSSDGTGFSFYYESPDDWISGSFLSDRSRKWMRAD